MKKFFFLAIFAAAALVGCQKGEGPSIETESDPFDFATTKLCRLTVDYGQVAAFEVFTSNPANDASAEPIFRAFTQEANGGIYDGPVRIPTGTDKLYIRAGYGDVHSQTVYTASVVDGAATASAVVRSSEVPVWPDDVYYIEFRSRGTLCFEDLWPNRGDYDINDLVVEYESTVWINRFNHVEHTENTFRVLHDGATTQLGFAFQIGASPSSLTKVEWTAPEVGTNTISGNVPYAAIPWEVDDKHCELGNSKINFMLFDDHRWLFNPKSTGHGSVREYKVNTYYHAGQHPDLADHGFPPYNPYVMVVTPDERNDLSIRRGREVHLASTTWYHPYGVTVLNPPTERMNPIAAAKWFGKYNDRSDMVSSWYISNDNYPFALDVPKLGFQYLRNVKDGQRYEGKKIDEIFPDFRTWASTQGKWGAQWYDYKWM